MRFAPDLVDVTIGGPSLRVRTMLHEGKSIEGLVDREVLAYIERRELYGVVGP